MDASLFSDQPAPKGQMDSSLFSEEPAPQAPGQIESFSRGAANNFPLLPQAIAGGEALTGLGDEGGYSKNLADWNAKAATAKAVNPKTYGAGAVAGAVAPLLIPGVGEALEGAPILGNAAYGAASALSNKDLSKDLPGTLKEGLTGAGIGAGMGAAFKGLGALAGKAGDVLEPAANRLEANATANALDINPRALYKIAQKEGTTTNPETVALDINKKLNKLFPDVIGLNDTGASKFQKLADAHDAASDMIGTVIKTTKDQAGMLPEVDTALAELKKAASKYHGLEFQDSVQSKAILDDASQMLRGLKERGQLDFRSLSDLKQEIGQIYHNPNNVVRGVDQTYAILSDTIDNVLDRVGVDNPTLKPAYDHAKEVFKFTSDILPAMGRGIARDVAGKAGGLTNAALGVGAMFHPGIAGAAYLGKTAAHMAAPELVPNLMYQGVNALRNGAKVPLQKAGQAVNQELIDYLTSRFGGK